MPDEHFQSTLGEHVLSLNRERFDILTNTKLFYQWDWARLGGILNHIYVRNPDHSSYVYKKGAKDLNIYVIVSGELEITVPYEYMDEEKTKTEIKGVLKALDSKHQMMKKYHRGGEFSLLKLSRGNYFGDEDGFMEEHKGYNVKVTSNNCKLFLIPKEVSFCVLVYTFRIVSEPCSSHWRILRPSTSLNIFLFSFFFNF